MNQHAKTINGLAGLVVALPDRCKWCESITAVIGNGSHPDIESLHCQTCGADRGQLSCSIHAFLDEIINRFGRPTAPIKIRRRGQARKNSETIPECAPTAWSASTGGSNAA